MAITQQENGLTRFTVKQDPGPPGAPPPPQISLYFGAMADRAALSASEEFVRASLQSRPEGEQLFDGDDFRRVFAQLEARPSGLTYLNLPKIQRLIVESEFVQGMLAGNEEAQPILELIRSPEYTGMGMGTTSVEIGNGLRRMTYGPKSLSGGLASAGIVAAIAVPNVIEALEKAKRKRTIADLRAISMALEARLVDVGGGYPTTGGDWREATTLGEALVPDYLGTIPAEDGWGHPLLYWSDGQAYRLVSPGKDGELEREWRNTPPVAGEPSPEFEADLVFDGNSFLIGPEE